jgi:3-oxoacyl-[acyl-carrier-protein] synthase-3
MSEVSYIPGVSIIGVGHHIPDCIVSNEDLCENLDVTPEWIIEKTGITGRSVAAPDDTASDFSIRAARQAMKMAGVNGEDIDLIIVCTFSGDYIFPPVSAKVQCEIGATGAHIFDVQANCAGFVTGLTCATDRMKLDPTVRHALVIGTELCTRYIDGTDENTAIFVADGSGAAVLGRTARGTGICSSAFFSDSSNYESVRMRGGGSSFALKGRSFNPDIDLMEMNGLATWKQAITHMPTTIRMACNKANVALDDVDFFIFHQANLRLIEYIVRKMRGSLKKTFTNVERIGNTGSASIAIALSEAVQKGLISEGDKVVLAGVGAGFNFGASVWNWAMPEIKESL